MGAWGYGAFHNDGALDWIGDKVEDPIASEIRKALMGFLKRKMTLRSVYTSGEPPKKVKLKGRGRGHDIAEAAVGLLDLLTPLTKQGKKTKKAPAGFRLNYQAERFHLYSLAVCVLTALLKDDAYLSTWRSRTMKVVALEALKKRMVFKTTTQVPLKKGRLLILR